MQKNIQKDCVEKKSLLGEINKKIGKVENGGGRDY